MSKAPAKKNCYSCLNLDYFDGDADETFGGYSCERKYWTPAEERKMLKKMDSDRYRAKAKVCHEPKGIQ